MIQLETQLYENTSDILAISNEDFASYQFPSDKEILKKFVEWNQQHGHLVENCNFSSEEFIKFFKVCKLIGNFIKKNNTVDNEVAYQHTCKVFVLFFMPPKKGKAFQLLKDFFNFAVIVFANCLSSQFFA